MIPYKATQITPFLSEIMCKSSTKIKLPEFSRKFLVKLLDKERPRFLPSPVMYEGQKDYSSFNFLSFLSITRKPFVMSENTFT